MIRGIFSRRPKPSISQSSVTKKTNIEPNLRLPDHVGHRRELCWWDPIYNPALHASLKMCDWNFKDNSGPVGQFIYGPTLNEKVEKGATYKLEQLTFRDCDFQGHFDPQTIVMFDNCHFLGCDFAHSSWKDTNFRNCSFEDCSISLASFERCEFRDNKWERIGISGSKTEFNKCFITNPDELILSSVSRTRPSDHKLRSRVYQWYRLQGTKAHLTRTIMLSHEYVGDDQTFYNTARLHDLQESYATISYEVNSILFPEKGYRVFAVVRLVFKILENILLRIFGFINGWGSSTMRPFVAIGIIYVLFGLIYTFAKFKEQIPNAYQKSFNITTLAGYSNEFNKDISSILTLVQDIHVMASIIIYSVFFGTIISRLSRVR